MTYEVNAYPAGTVTVTWVDLSVSDLTVPATVSNGGNTYTVIRINKNAFRDHVDLESVIIPDSVTVIEGRAFEGCSKLTSVTLSNSITTIEYNTFKGCSSLQSVIIPNGVTAIGNSAFEGCGITDVSLPDALGSIGISAFHSCTGLQSVVLPDLITDVADNAFMNCTDLQSVTLPANAARIGSSAFKDCHSLESVTIPDSVTEIGHNAFFDCSKLGSVTLPANITSIGYFTFLRCTSLTSVIIPDNVTLILDYAFYECTGLLSITLPESLVSMEYAAFALCTSLTSVTVPDNVTNIGDFVFYGCSGLTSVTIPNSVTALGKGVFQDCSGLNTLRITSGTGGNATSTVLVDSMAAGEFSWDLQNGNATISTLIIDAHNLSIPEIKGMAGKTVVFTSNAVSTEGAETFHLSDGTPLTGAERAGRTYIYDTSRNIWRTIGVFFDPNGGNGGSVSTISAEPGGTVTVPAYGFTRTGFQQTGWNTEADGSGTPYSAGDTFTMPAGDVMLYAVWSSLHTATVNLNNGSVGSVPSGWVLDGTVYKKDFPFGTPYSTIAADFGTPTRTGHTFNGFQPDTGTLSVSGVTMTAQWSLMNYTAYINLDGGEVGSVPSGWTFDGSVYKKDFPFGTPYSTIVADFGVPVRDGYAFDGFQQPSGTLGTSGVAMTAHWHADSPLFIERSYIIPVSMLLSTLILIPLILLLRPYEVTVTIGTETTTEKVRRGSEYRFTMPGGNGGPLRYKVGKDGVWRIILPDAEGQYVIPEGEIYDHTFVEEMPPNVTPPGMIPWI